MERHYETICILRPDMPEGALKDAMQKAKGALESGKGTMNLLEEWGRRKLAYPIRKKNEGYYVLFNYTCMPEAGKELERTLKYNENVLRYQTVVLEEPAKKPVAVVAVVAAPAEGGQTNEQPK